MTEETQTFKLHDSTIAGFMQLLTLAIGTGTNLLDHFRLLELVPSDEDGTLVMTQDFINRTESLAEDLMGRLDKVQDAEDAKKDDGEIGFGFV